MKKLLTLTLLMLLSTTSIFAQHMGKDKERASPHETVTGPNVKVTYGRPYKKGRDIFGGLEAYGKVWRTGADEATLFITQQPIVMGGTTIPAGCYTLWTLPNEDGTAKLIINKQIGQWGVDPHEPA